MCASRDTNPLSVKPCSRSHPFGYNPAAFRAFIPDREPCYRNNPVFVTKPVRKTPLFFLQVAARRPVVNRQIVAKRITWRVLSYALYQKHRTKGDRKCNHLCRTIADPIHSTPAKCLPATQSKYRITRLSRSPSTLISQPSTFLLDICPVVVILVVSKLSCARMAHRFDRTGRRSAWFLLER